MNKYYQCKMRCGSFETVGWIEARGAEVGNLVELLPDRQLWEVVEVFDHGLTKDHLKEIQLLNRNSLPSVDGMTR